MKKVSLLTFEIPIWWGADLFIEDTKVMPASRLIKLIIYMYFQYMQHASLLFCFIYLFIYLFRILNSISSSNKKTKTKELIGVLAKIHVW